MTAAEPLVQVGVHPSQFPERLRAELIQSLRTRRMNHKFHYETRKQAQYWLRLHLACSPIHRDRDGQQSYQRAFRETAQRLAAGPIHIVGLGCGDGGKELRLIELLQVAHDCSFVAIDVSLPLALMARNRVASLIPPGRCHALVCDLGTAGDLDSHLDSGASPGTPRLLTFFGVIPNFEPGRILPQLGHLLRPGDHLLLSANLAPGADYFAAVNSIRPQYDNPPTRDWLFLLLDDLGVDRADGHITFSVEPDPAWHPLARISASFEFDRPRSIALDDDEFRFERGDTLRLFFSYRHTSASIRDLLARHGIRVDAEWITASGEEGIFHGHCEATPNVGLAT
jgi:L-histidine Nalpha-methyltransferase